ncbi:MAG: M23 family metallopeptidase [Polyangiaceae bacterium]|nr:M23 family metallopeptidase [Polyangiaceae bacterium]
MLRRGLVCAIVSLAGCSASEANRLEGILPPAAISAVAQPAPELKKVVVAETPKFAPRDPALAYVLGVDMGVRSDDGGKGFFLAPRAHGKHNGIDFLAPVGTPVLAACDGKARSDNRGGYGHVVQLVCKLPNHLGGDEGLHASFFYAHLDKSVPPKGWTHVRAGQKLGTVGKTGNASGPKIKPHLHLELIIRGSAEEALAETHSGANKNAAAATDRFLELLAEECLEPAKFAAVHGEIRRERRADPFVVLMCAAKPKPDLTEPSDSVLKAAQTRWSEHYVAGGFDVDAGPR